MSDTERLAALLHDLSPLYDGFHHIDCRDAAVRLIAAGVRLPTEAGDGLRAALAEFDDDLLAGTSPEIAVRRLRAALAAAPAPTLDREGEP